MEITMSRNSAVKQLKDLIIKAYDDSNLPFEFASINDLDNYLSVNYKVIDYDKKGKKYEYEQTCLHVRQKNRNYLIFANDLFKDGKWEDLLISVKNKEYFDFAVLLGKIYEGITNKSCEVRVEWVEKKYSETK